MYGRVSFILSEYLAHSPRLFKVKKPTFIVPAFWSSVVYFLDYGSP